MAWWQDGQTLRALRRVFAMLCNRITDCCVQLHGGYGSMRGYPVARAWADSGVQSIFGGTTEIMKEIIGRGLGL